MTFFPLRQEGGAEVTDDSIQIRSQALPFSSFASEEAKAAFLHRENNPYPSPPDEIDAAGPAVDQWRREVDEKIFSPLLEQAKELYSVKVEPIEIAGVKAVMVKASEGASVQNEDRILINLHGGGFVLGGLVNGQLESIPVAAVGRIPVITLDYRMAPEHRFPAATIDVDKVYTHLLKTYRPENIGIYGTSAGGWLTAQAVAWFQQQGLPSPGAIGIMAMGAGGYGHGDSSHLWGGANSKTFSYLSLADLRDPLVSPLFSPDVLSKFPPTLVLTSTRAMDLSAVVHTDIQLTKAGVVSELHVWDGLGHGDFLYQPNTPENKDAVKMIAAFFQRHLGVKNP